MPETTMSQFIYILVAVVYAPIVAYIGFRYTPIRERSRRDGTMKFGPIVMAIFFLISLFERELYSLLACFLILSFALALVYLKNYNNGKEYPLTEVKRNIIIFSGYLFVYGGGLLFIP